MAMALMVENVLMVSIMVVSERLHVYVEATIQEKVKKIFQLRKVKIKKKNYFFMMENNFIL